jgi:hypothetical protein
MSVRNGRTSCFPADPSTHVSMSGYCQTSWVRRAVLEPNPFTSVAATLKLTQLEFGHLLFSLDRVISDHLPSVSSRRLQPLYILSRSAAIDITSILLTAVLSDQRGVPIILHAILSRTRGWCYCWNATRVRTFQSLDSGSKLKYSLQVSRSLMPGPCLFGILWNEAIACSVALGWTIVWQRLLDPSYLLLGRLQLVS